MGRFQKQWTLRLLGISCLLLLLFFFFSNYKIARVSGESMVPIIQNNELVVIQKNQLPHRYDLVAFEHEGRLIVKRVIGVPGDSYARSGNRLLLGASGSYYDFSYTFTLTQETARELPIGGILQPGEYFVVGDAIMHSIDSREFGMVTSEALRGVVLNLF